jgi:hypothetical protein
MTRDRWLVVTMAAFWAAAGLITPHLPRAGNPQEAVSVVLAFAMAFLLFAWCKAHARTHSIQMPSAAPVLVALFAIVGFPYYAFRGYPFGRALLLLVFAAVTFIGLSVLYGVCFALSGKFGP